MTRSSPLRHRRKAGDPSAMALVFHRAARFNEAEVQNTMLPILQAFQALREGVGNELQWARVVSAMNMADAIETQVRPSGMRGHFQAAQLALDGIKCRAMDTGTWQPVPLYTQEIDHIEIAVDLHDFQLQNVSRGGYLKAQAYAVAEVRCGGGVVLTTIPAGEQLAIAGV